MRNFIKTLIALLILLACGVIMFLGSIAFAKEDMKGAEIFETQDSTITENEPVSYPEHTGEPEPTSTPTPTPTATPVKDWRQEIPEIERGHIYCTAHCVMSEIEMCSDEYDACTMVPALLCNTAKPDGTGCVMKLSHIPQCITE